MLLATTASCSLFAPSIDAELAERMSAAVFDSEDVDTVLEGIPAFVILLDGVIASEPDQPEPWLAAAQLNSALSSLVVDQPERSRLLAAKALRYAAGGLARQSPDLADLRDCSFDALHARLAGAGKEDVPAMIALAAAWSSWIRASGEDLDAVGDLPRVRAVLDRCLVLDESAAGGIAHLYLGAFASFVSPEMGGDLEPARRHFERVIELSNGTDLNAKTSLALQYAERKGDRALRDRLLLEVDTADPRSPGRTFFNVLAQRRARAVLAGGKDPWAPF